MSVLGPLGKLILTVAEPSAAIRLLSAEIAGPVIPVAVNVIIPPAGIPELASIISTGFAVLSGKIISLLPVGVAGATIPAMLVKVIPGRLGTKIGDGPAKLKGGEVCAVNCMFSVSRRILPGAPLVPSQSPPKLLLVIGPLPACAVMEPTPVKIVAIIRIAPPLPPPPEPLHKPAAGLITVVPVAPPLAEIVPDIVSVLEEAINNAPPPPPDPKPVGIPAPPPPPEPPSIGIKALIP